ncbi:hypothetical protein FBY58_1768 [Zymomonas mobilis]|uniref:Uncharacterized protein n=1 Tax=Zymomonas mobilis TaxID=542 RepID=A0A542VUM5_ZYMMB|nr:hypothetical protein FBY58_1768 [Zymomonas mobilis]
MDFGSITVVYSIRPSRYDVCDQPLFCSADGFLLPRSRRPEIGTKRVASITKRWRIPGRIKDGFFEVWTLKSIPAKCLFQCHSQKETGFAIIPKPRWYHGYLGSCYTENYAKISLLLYSKSKNSCNSAKNLNDERSQKIKTGFLEPSQLVIKNIF